MENLQSRLKKAQEKALSEKAWSAFDAVTFILNDFREKVKTNSLAVVNDGLYPRYEFSIDEIVLPKESDVKLRDWVQHKEYVLGIIQTSTGMEATCRPNNSIIELRPRSQQAQQVQQADSALSQWGDLGPWRLGDVSFKESANKRDGIWEWLFNAR